MADNVTADIPEQGQIVTVRRRRCGVMPTVVPLPQLLSLAAQTPREEYQP